MKKSNIKELKVNDNVFKRLKKYKKTIYLISANEEIKENSKIIISNANDKKIKRKIKKVYNFENKEEVYTNFKKKEKYIMSEYNLKTDGVTSIEFKYKKKVFRKLFLICLILAFIIVSALFVKKIYNEGKINKLKKDINNIQLEKIEYVILEINPKMVLEIKNNLIVSKGCLNEDCKKIFKEINFNGKDLKEAIELMYNKSKEYNIDVSNGVKMYSQNSKYKDSVKDLDYVKYENINKKEEKKYLDKVLDNKEIKQQNKNDDYNSKLLELYKKDNDYGKLYTCSIVNEEVGCYITDEFMDELSEESDTLEALYESIANSNKFANILKKFNIKYASGKVEGLDLNIINSVYINGQNYRLFGGVCHSISTISANPEDDTQTKTTCYNKVGITIESTDDTLASEIKTVVLPLNKFNLASASYNSDDLVTLLDDKSGEGLIIIE